MMDAVARAAGVGRATLYRRYPDVASLALALLDSTSAGGRSRSCAANRRWGPGAAPAKRLAAFYAAMVILLERHAALLLGAEVGRSRFAPAPTGSGPATSACCSSPPGPKTPSRWSTSCSRHSPPRCTCISGRIAG
jgi:AcrR family transcriptional regulator